MTSTLVSLIKVTVLSTGTGALSLGPPSHGYRGTDGLVNGQVYGYSIQQNGNWEYGRGTFLQGTMQLVRSPVSSSAGGLPINLTANSEVSFVLLAEDLEAVISDIAARLINGLTNSSALTAVPITASGAIAAGDFVNYVNSGGVAIARTAVANDVTRFANGFALIPVTHGSSGLILMSGINTAAVVASGSAGEVWLSDTTPGGFTTTPPTTSGSFAQSLGSAMPGLGIQFHPGPRLPVL